MFDPGGRADTLTFRVSAGRQSLHYGLLFLCQTYCVCVCKCECETGTHSFYVFIAFASTFRRGSLENKCSYTWNTEKHTHKYLLMSSYTTTACSCHICVSLGTVCLVYGLLCLSGVKYINMNTTGSSDGDFFFSPHGSTPDSKLRSTADFGLYNRDNIKWKDLFR